MPKQDQLLGWDVSPYTAKVRSYFNYKNIPYEYKPPNAYTLARKVQPAVGKMIMPTVFKPNGEVFQDSSVIIDAYEQNHPQHPVIPATANQAFTTLSCELFADEWLPLAALHYRWNYPGNYNFIIGEFGKNALPHFPKFIQTKVAKQFAGKMSGYLPILGITNKMEPALESAVEKFFDLLNDHFKQHRFLLGDRPTLGDFSLYGPLYAHLDRDPEPADLVKKYSDLHNWLMTMHGSFSNVKGELLADDEVPETLVPVMQHMATLQAPLIRQSVSAIATWANENPDLDKLPQRLGEAEINIGGKTETRYNLTYGYWMVQRITELLANRSGDASALIKQLGLEDIFADPLPVAVTLKRARLYRK